MKPGFQLPPDAPAPRSCLIVKENSGEEYGYNLHAERGKGQFIGAVDENSPASRAGLRPGDRIFAVNGTSIAGESHRSVVGRIKDNPLQCELLVLSEDGAEWYQAHGISVSNDLPNIIRLRSELSTLSVEPGQVQQPEIFTASTSVTFGGGNSSSSQPPAEHPEEELQQQCSSSTPEAPPSKAQSESSSGESPIANWYIPKSQNKEQTTAPKSSSISSADAPPQSNGHMNPCPRLCNLEKTQPTDEFGFNLHAEKGGGHFIGAVDFGGIGFRAGLALGQRIVGVNGELIYPNTVHNKVVSLIKQDPLKTQLLVASEEVDRWFAENKAAYSFDHAIVFRDPLLEESTRVVHSHRQHHHHPELVDEHVPEQPSHSPPASVCDEEPPVANAARAVAEDQPVAPTPALPQDDIMAQVFGSVSLAETHVKQGDSGCVKHVHEIVVGADVGESEVPPATFPTPADLSSDNCSTTKSVSSHRSDLPKETVQLAHVDDRPKLEPYFSPSPVLMPSNMSNASKVASVTPISRNVVSDSNSNFTVSAKSVNEDDASMDIFKMSAAEARARIKNRKKDLRKGNDMSLDEKHRLIANM
ncbi:hypothetical protein L596_005914 [Steinernema carpocapsae]|uniref:PDZ domain-containing protein n=1 Tax=Steinernema carpocapsae TaxID=34508 RepID=A0A4U8V230_STECR|nr:hypothetical protein L596_005914 [Steinernema carpocapsae]